MIPSRLKKSESEDSTSDAANLFIDKAIGSIRAQRLNSSLEIQILVGVDEDAEIPERLALDRQIRFFKSASRSQAAALNAAARHIDSDFVSILEDDDRWHPRFLYFAQQAMAAFDFSSSTQLEVTADRNILKINDFPTPSGWFMKAAVFEKVGLFNEDFRWHLDNEWLGRLAETGAKRTHLVEATAPKNLATATYSRPRLAMCLKNGGPSMCLTRHKQFAPIVVRLVHPGSGMSQIRRNAEYRAQSNRENEQLMAKFGRVPW